MIRERDAMGTHSLSCNDGWGACEELAIAICLIRTQTPHSHCLRGNNETNSTHANKVQR